MALMTCSPDTQNHAAHEHKDGYAVNLRRTIISTTCATATHQQHKCTRQSKKRKYSDLCRGQFESMDLLLSDSKRSDKHPKKSFKNDKKLLSQKDKKSPYKCPKKNVKKYKELQFRMAPNASSQPVTSKFEGMDMNEIVRGAFTRMINAIKEKDQTGMLFTAVDLPAYRLKIKTPIHFGDILRRINGRRYRRVRNIQKDIARLFNNCYKFNGQPDPRIKDDFSTWAQSLQDELDQHMQTLHENLVAYGYIGSSSHSRSKLPSKRSSSPRSMPV